MFFFFKKKGNYENPYQNQLRKKRNRKFTRNIHFIQINTYIKEVQKYCHIIWISPIQQQNSGLSTFDMHTCNIPPNLKTTSKNKITEIMITIIQYSYTITNNKLLNRNYSTGKIVHIN